MPLRRSTKRWPALAAFAAVVCGCAEPAHVSRRWTVMGTYAGAEVYSATEDGATEAIDEIRKAFASVDASMSSWRQDSELRRLNERAREGFYRIEDPELYRCVKVALELARLTEGTFDPTVGPLVDSYGFRTGDPSAPSAEEIAAVLPHVGFGKVELVQVSRSIRFLTPGAELDLGGIAKGYALDVAIRTFARPGSKGGLVDLGRSLFAWRNPPGRDGWTVGIQDPQRQDGILATIEIANRAVSTSGVYENSFEQDGRAYGHILDPRTGEPPRTDVVSATVLADSGAQADAMSTALFVAGSQRGATILEKFVRIEAVLLVRRQRGLELLASASLRGRVILDPEFAPTVGGRVRYLLPPVELRRSGLPWFQ